MTKYNNESGEKPPVIEEGADINITDDKGNPIGNTGFTVNMVRSTYVPVVGRAGGAPTSVTAKADYRRYGREIFDLRMDISVAGGSDVVKASLPCNPYRDTVFTGFDRANSQTMVQGRVGAQDPNVYFYMSDGSKPPANFQPLMRGGLECSQF
ncbi:hypothetical protein R1A27_22210 [Methylobacterium sp. NMS12]|uniref:hypothetical protein n=1 Tax=Methylobacterium sp. NMS12 TaxID=3079766 RepID=UPI003F880EB9